MDGAVDGARSDRELIAAIIAEDGAALGELYRRHSAALLCSALRLCRERGDAEDVLHDVFLEAWRRAATYDPARGSVASWLSVRLKSRAIDFLVRRRRHATLSSHYDSVGTSSARRALTTEIVAVRRVLAAMNPRCAKFLVAAYVEQWSSAELAAATGIPVATVKSRLAAARDNFLATLRRAFPAPRMPATASRRPAR